MSDSENISNIRKSEAIDPDREKSLYFMESDSNWNLDLEGKIQMNGRVSGIGSLIERCRLRWDHRVILD